eukprot:274393-Hanusia_phi.AAC.3
MSGLLFVRTGGGGRRRQTKSYSNTDMNLQQTSPRMRFCLSSIILNTTRALPCFSFRPLRFCCCMVGKREYNIFISLTSALPPSAQRQSLQTYPDFMIILVFQHTGDSHWRFHNMLHARFFRISRAHVHSCLGHHCGNGHACQVTTFNITLIYNMLIASGALGIVFGSPLHVDIIDRNMGELTVLIHAKTAASACSCL